jgi:hypothetical protein
MARRDLEQEVIDRFAEFLFKTTGRLWKPSADEVSTLKNKRKYDCEFTCSDALRIAADVCSLFPLGSHQGDQAKRQKLIARLTPEVRKHGLGGLMLTMPPVERKHAHPDWPRRAAAAIRKAVDLQPLDRHSELEVEGFEIRRVGEAAEPSHFVSMTMSGYQPADAAGAALATLLENKHDQLDVDGHQRFLIVKNDGCRAHAKDVTASCAFIDFRQYPNFDRIYFEESEGHFQLVYDREAWAAMEAGRPSNESQQRQLVAHWLEARLSGHWPGALDAALSISWELGGADWLSEGGRACLELEADLFLQESDWDAPRQLMELLRGPGERIFDGRRRAHPIRPR